MALDAFPTVSVEELRRRSVGYLLRMGHCAPSVMQTLVDASDADAGWLVRLVAGLPGGIGNTGGECGGLTAPLVLMGLRYGREESADGFPVVVEKGHDLLRRFTESRGTTQCRTIRGNARVPLRCIGVVRQAPSMCARCLAASSTSDAVPFESRQAYRELVAHWRQRGFHCAGAVFAEFDAAEGEAEAAPDEVGRAVTAFMGGTVLSGMTCGALTAGVMGLGLALGEVEDSRLRVLRMIATMAVGGEAFEDDVNAFNRVMNLGQALARWFEAEFGSTQCRTVTGCDFATTEGVHTYIAHDGTSDCVRIARLVAARVGQMLADAGPHRS